MHTPGNIQDNQNVGLIPWKVLAYGLFVAVIGLGIYIYNQNLSAQAAVDTKQDTKIASVEQLTRQLGTANLLLTQIVCQQKGTNCAALNLNIKDQP